MHLHWHTARPIKTFPFSSSWLYDSHHHLSVLIAQASEAEASAAGLTSHLILSIKASRPHLMPSLCYWRTDHNYSPVCRACQQQQPQLFTKSSSLTSNTPKQYLTHICKEIGTCAHTQRYTARLAWQWQMIRCSDVCCHGDSKARDPRWECDFLPILNLGILFLNSYCFIKTGLFIRMKEGNALLLHLLRGKKRGTWGGLWLFCWLTNLQKSHMNLIFFIWRVYRVLQVENTAWSGPSD